jgi:hypothetical protein
VKPYVQPLHSELDFKLSASCGVNNIASFSLGHVYHAMAVLLFSLVFL